MDHITAIQQLVLSKLSFDGADVPFGEYEFDFVVRFSGNLKKDQDSLRRPTTSIPYLTAMALLVRRMGIQRDEAVRLILAALQEALEVGGNKKAEEILLEEVGVAEAKAQLEIGLDTLPKKIVKGKTHLNVNVEVYKENKPKLAFSGTVSAT